MQDLVDRLARETSKSIDCGAKLGIPSDIQFRGKQMAMILIGVVIENRFGLCNGKTGIVLRTCNDRLELGLCEVIIPIHPEARAADQRT
jgi:hypothetical protein